VPNEQRRKELSRLMIEQPNGLELVMRRYQEVTGAFPPPDLTPREIIEEILKREDGGAVSRTTSQ
jgi:hypothetical protein